MKSKVRKTWLCGVILFLFSFGGLFYCLNIKTTTRKGVNYKVKFIQVPLYLKALDFLSRHYNYKLLVNQILHNSDMNSHEKILKLLDWTYENIKRVPDGFPIIDDHVLNIIIRGYGTDDQMMDVFAVLSNYTGFKAFFSWIENGDTGSRIPLAFVMMEGKWRVFDSYRGNYFINKNGSFASIEDIKAGNWIVEGVLSGEKNMDYTDFFKNLSITGDINLKRSRIQSPLNRIIFELKKF